MRLFAVRLVCRIAPAEVRDRSAWPRLIDRGRHQAGNLFPHEDDGLERRPQNDLLVRKQEPVNLEVVANHDERKVLQPPTRAKAPTNVALSLATPCGQATDAVVCPEPTEFSSSEIDDNHTECNAKPARWGSNVVVREQQIFSGWRTGCELDRAGQPLGGAALRKCGAKHPTDNTNS